MKKLIFLLVVTIFFLCKLSIYAELRELNFSLHSSSRYLKNFTIEIRKLILDPYNQNYSDLGIIYSHQVTDKLSFSANLEDTEIYYINIKPYNIYEIFIPKLIDTLNITLKIDENDGYALLVPFFNDSLNLLYKNYRKWENEKLFYKKSYDSVNFADYEYTIGQLFFNNDAVLSFKEEIQDNVISSNSLQIDFYLCLLKYMKKNAGNMDSSLLADKVLKIDDFVQNSQINKFDWNYFLILIDRLMDFKILLFSIKELSHLEKFRLKNDYIKLYSQKIQQYLYYNHFLYSMSIYYETNTMEKLNDILLIIDDMKHKTGFDEELVESLSSIFDTTSASKKHFDFSIPIDSIGSKIPKNLYENKVVLVNFWTSWCPHCKDLMEFSMSLKEKFNEKDFSIINISLDGIITNWKIASNKYPVGNHYISIGSDGNQYSKDYFINGVPRCFLIDRSGNVCNDNLPIPLDQSIYGQIEKLLKFE